MPQLDEYLRQLAPSMTQWRRDFHLHAESGWLEFRTASKVAEILDGLGYQLALGRDVIDADSRMGLPDEETLAQAFERAREQGAPERWLPAFEGGFAGVVATLEPLLGLLGMKPAGSPSRRSSCATATNSAPRPGTSSRSPSPRAACASSQPKKG